MASPAGIAGVFNRAAEHEALRVKVHDAVQQLTDGTRPLSFSQDVRYTLGRRAAGAPGRRAAGPFGASPRKPPRVIP